jgi:PhzF family phenazine biosynthesis protein
MKLPLYWIDAFTECVFAGNPAAVVRLAEWLDDATMQRIAFENGLAETAFFVPLGPARFHLRWFTPMVEVDLCGHATLASAFAVFTGMAQSGDTVTFESRSGPLTVSRKQDGKLQMDFPATPVRPETDASVLRATIAALGHKPIWQGRSRFDRFVQLADAAAVRSLQPDLGQVAAVGGRGLIVTAAGDGACDFVSRFFAPQSGINEDPVTGSSHCALTPFWAGKLHRLQLHARQLSARGGELWCEYVPSDMTADARVRIAGHAVAYLRGEITV